MITIQDARDAKIHMLNNADLTGVNGIGITKDDNGNYVLKVNFTDQTALDIFPTTYQTIAVVKQLINPITALDL